MTKPASLRPPEQINLNTSFFFNSDHTFTPVLLTPVFLQNRSINDFFPPSILTRFYPMVLTKQKKETD